MTIEFAWERHPTHDVVRIAGSPHLGQAISALEVIAVETAQASRLLIDMRGIDTLQSFTDQFALGQAAARRLRHLSRVASVVPPGRLTRNSERPAREDGLDLKVFESEEEALGWLLAQE